MRERKRSEVGGGWMDRGRGQKWGRGVDRRGWGKRRAKKKSVLNFILIGI